MPDGALPCWLLQADINEKMRAILVDWLVEVHLKFKVRGVAFCEATRPVCCLPQRLLTHRRPALRS